MYQERFKDFITSGDSLIIYNDNNLVYHSCESMLLPLMNYLKTKSHLYNSVVVFDKIVGNAAALLLVLVKCAEVYSPLASEPAIKTLEQNSIKHHIQSIVPFIQKAGTDEVCPMEKLSLGKNPHGFYQELLALASKKP